MSEIALFLGKSWFLVLHFSDEVVEIMGFFSRARVGFGSLPERVAGQS